MYSSIIAKSKKVKTKSMAKVKAAAKIHLLVRDVGHNNVVNICICIYAYGPASSLFLKLLMNQECVQKVKSTKIGLDTRHPWVYYFYLSKFTRIMT